MVKFILVCAFMIVGSFTVIPAFKGITGEHGVMMASIEPAIGVEEPIDNGTGLSFEEIYALVDVYEQDDIASILNDLEPAAGGEAMLDLGAIAEAETIIELNTEFGKELHPAL